MVVKVTEAVHPLTHSLGSSSHSLDILRLLRSSDSSLYSGYQHFPALSDPSVHFDLRLLSVLVEENIRHPYESAIVLVGCGTSGRLASIVAHAFNAVLAKRKKNTPQVFHALLAGQKQGAFFRSVENAEDNFELGKSDLANLFKSKPKLRRAIVIGISCGFTAAYVAGALRLTWENKHYASAVVGFNPLPQQQDDTQDTSPFASALTTARQLAQSQPGQHFVINPIVGPEAVAGSTRLKSGTATLAILETVFALALSKVHQLPLAGGVPVPPRMPHPSDVAAGDVVGDGQPGAAASVADLLACCEDAQRAAYAESAQLAKVADAAADALRSGGRVVYVAAGSLGTMAVVDASEQPPTFGAARDDFSASVVGGFHNFDAGRREDDDVWCCRFHELYDDMPSDQKHRPADGVEANVAATDTGTPGADRPKSVDAPVELSSTSVTAEAAAATFPDEVGMYVTAAANSGRPIAGPCTLPYPQRFEAAHAFLKCGSLLDDTGAMRFGGALSAATEKAVRSIATNLGDDAKLMLYALGRQVEDGPCTESAPTSWSIVENAKYRAYQALGKMDKLEAMRLFVKTLDEDAKEWWALCVKGAGEASSSGGESAVPSPAPAPAPAPAFASESTPSKTKEETIRPKPTSFAHFISDLRQQDVVIVLAASGPTTETVGTPYGKPAVAWTPEHVSTLISAHRRVQFGIHVVQLAVGRHDRVLCDAFSVGKDANFWRREIAAEDAAAAAAAAEVQVVAALRAVAVPGRRGSWITLRLPPSLAAPLLPGLATFDRLVMKHVLNAISTTAHVLVGKVFGNRMVDVRVANIKLYQRAVGIVRAVLEGEGGGAVVVDDESAERLLLRSIYGDDAGSAAAPARGDEMVMQRHVSHAVSQTGVVPTAIVLGLLGDLEGKPTSVAEARRVVAEKRPGGVRSAIQRLL